MLLKTNRDKKFINLAINLAKDRIGLTGTNPSVGCVIVKNNRIISIGQTGFGGTPHAEVNAINNASETVKDSTLYVSLEPCSHYGKTKPCTNKIIKSKIKKVVYSVDDIDTRSSGKSYSILKKKKIKCVKHILNKRGSELYKSYFHLKTRDFPYVTGKIACTKNYLFKNNSKYISNNHSINFSHFLRYINHAILISYKTANTDNPKLNCRLNGLEKYSPIRIIIDKNLKIKENLYLVKSSKKVKTYIFYNKKNYKYNRLKAKGIKLIYCPIDENNNLDLIFIMKKIKSLKINYLLVEGGKFLTKEFLNHRLFNCFYLFKSNKISSFKKKYKILNIIKLIKKNFSKSNKVNTYLENDIILRHYN